MSDKIKRLEEQLAAERAKLAEVRASITDEDRAEISLRKEIGRARAEREEEERTKRRAALDERVEVARESLGPDALIESLMVKSFPDTFIVRRNGRAHMAWQDATGRSHVSGGKRADRTQIHKTYAMAVIYEWNGVVFDDGVHPDETRKLSKFLDENPGVITPITDLAVELAGVFADARSKSD